MVLAFGVVCARLLLVVVVCCLACCWLCFAGCLLWVDYFVGWLLVFGLVYLFL